MERDLVLLSLGRALADLAVGASVGLALSGEPVTAGAALVGAVVGVALGARLAEKKGRRARVAGQVLAAAATGAAVVPRIAAAGLALTAAGAAIGGVLLLRERAERMKDRPRLAGPILGIGGGAAIAHAAPLGASRAAVSLAILAFGGALAAMATSALFVGPGRPPPRAAEVGVFLLFGAATVLLLSLAPR